jgi:hypothetical protein
MKKIVYFVLLASILSCAKDKTSFFNPQSLPNSGTTNSAGYNCINGSCVYTSNNAQYPSLSTCKTYCKKATIIPGMVNIKVYCAPYPSPWNNCKAPYSAKIGLGYSSNDVANEAFFIKTSYGSSGNTFSVNNLAPGVYYYGGKKTFNSASCGTGQGIPPVTTDRGSFTITSGGVTSVNVSL